MSRYLFFILTLFCFQSLLSQEELNYSLEEPYEIYKLPEYLEEVSALTHFEGSMLAMLNDELGRMYLFDLDQKSIDKRVRFKGNGDFEGIERVGDYIYAIKSDGDLYKFHVDVEGVVEEITTPFSKSNNVEGIAYDPFKNRLLFALKDSGDVGNFDVTMPLLDATYNPDDGIFIGGGLMFKKDGFRRSPYASKQSISGVYAFATSSFGINYSGEFIKAIGKANLELDVSLLSPNFVNNFFGLGNETDFNEERGINYYRTRFEAYLIHPKVVFNLGDFTQIKFGARAYGVNIIESQDRFIADFPNNGLNPNGLFDFKAFAGPEIGLETETQPEVLNPKSGVNFNLLYRYSGGSMTIQIIHQN